MSSDQPAQSRSRPPLYGGRLPSGQSHRGRSSSAGAPARWTEHYYTLSDARDPPWATLMVRSRAISPSHLPSTFEGEDITGMVSLNLPREEAIKAVVVSVVGQITTSVIDVYSFLNLSQQLWSVEMGDPAATASTEFTGRLYGHHQWPFTFTIPPNVEISNSNGTKDVYRTPPSFSERLTSVHIQYQLIVRIRRGKFRIDSQLSTVFAYTPFTYPDQFSEARQAAYRYNYPVPGPEEDPPGWTSLESVEVHGTVFNSRRVDILCRLSLANPLMYTRGTVIPCSLSIDCSDTQALDLLSMPNAVDVRLLRHISRAPGTVITGSAGPSRYGIEFEETRQDVKTAVWWLSSDSPHRRILSGEIHLPKDLKPNCRIGRFDLYYTVNMFPFKAVAFNSEHATPDTLVAQPVAIATAYSSGPRPRIYSPSPPPLPPGYDDASSHSRPPSDYSFRT